MINELPTYQDITKQLESSGYPFDRAELNHNAELIKGLFAPKFVANQFAKIADYYKHLKEPLSIGAMISQIRKFHPLLGHVYVAEHFSKDQFKHSLSLFEMNRLANSIERIKRKKVTGLEEKLSKLTQKNLKDSTELDRIMFEIFRAAEFSDDCQEIEFLAEKPKEAIRTPDLLIDGAIEVECKRKHFDSYEMEKHNNHFKSIASRTEKVMLAKGYNCFISITTKDKLDESKANLAVETFNNFDPTIDFEKEFDFAEQGMSLKFLVVSQVDVPVSATDLTLKWESEVEKSDQVIKKEGYCCFEARNWNQNVRMWTLKSDKYKTEAVVKNIIRVIKDAAEQLSQTKASIIVVNIGDLVKKFNDCIWTELHKEISSFYRTHQFVNTIYLCSDVIKDGKLVNVGHVLNNSIPLKPLKTNFFKKAV